MKRCFFRRSATAACLTAFLTVGWPVSGQPGAAPPAAGQAQKPKDTTEELQLETSDGAEVVAWYYPVEEETSPLGTVILVHDLGGSHLTVEPLAKSLQASGYAVVAPDLRGHGKSVLKNLPAAQEDQSKLLKKPDFDMIAASRGGQKRDQSGVRGDIESVRNWIKQQADENKFPVKPFFVVGSGLGASLAATWTAADFLWPELATGPQGRSVTGLIMVSPTFTTKGYSIAPALMSEAVRRAVPLLVIAGAEDRDAVKVFDQLKRQRPKAWFDSRHPFGDEKDASPVNAADASLLLIVNPASRSGDALAAQRSPDPRARGGDPAALIIGFMKIAATMQR
ncbi:MAG: alpha/beta fold hydrolase [Planctomycetia bacterium]|nr:alpha/beta fold hydrolase [Planctomycetia bacterium]